MPCSLRSCLSSTTVLNMPDRWNYFSPMKDFNHLSHFSMEEWNKNALAFLYFLRISSTTRVKWRTKQQKDWVNHVCHGWISESQCYHRSIEMVLISNFKNFYDMMDVFNRNNRLLPMLLYMCTIQYKQHLWVKIIMAVQPHSSYFCKTLRIMSGRE